MLIKLFDIIGFTPKADGSVGLRINTAYNQSDAEQAAILSLFQKRCMIAIKPEETPFLDKELKDLDSVNMDLEDKSKSLSKQLRNALYILWQQEGEEAEYKDYYKSRMEKLIEQVKNRLD